MLIKTKLAGPRADDRLLLCDVLSRTLVDRRLLQIDSGNQSTHSVSQSMVMAKLYGRLDGAAQVYIYTLFMNSLKLNVATTIIHVISASLVAFGFARLSFPLKGLWFSILLMTLMLPGQVTLIPQYMMFHSFDWINTYLPLIVPSAMGGAFFIFLIVQFIRGIPRELDESAKSTAAPGSAFICASLCR